MHRKIIFFLFAVTLTVATSAQSKSNASINDEIKALRAEESITLTYDQEAKTSKIMAVAENFSEGEASRSGVLAMNFAVGFFYPGESINKAPDPLHFTFWVLAKKPRFAAEHSFVVSAGEETLDFGPARYAFRARDNIEYLNFEISRESLAKIARRSNVNFRLGAYEFTLTRMQLKLIADILTISDTGH